MKFLIKDFDQFGSNETLGVVQVPPKILYEAKGDRMEFKLQPVPGKTSTEVPGYIAIRCRRATADDKKFIEGYEGSMKAVAAPKAPKTNNNAIKSMITRTSKVEDGIKKVRPGYSCSEELHILLVVSGTVMCVIVNCSSKLDLVPIQSDPRKQSG